MTDPVVVAETSLTIHDQPAARRPRLEHHLNHRVDLSGI